MAVGILAYGSLLDDPGDRLGPLIVARDAVRTPFCVEYARSSRSRDGAPTLVPVAAGGASVPAYVLVLRSDVGEAEARRLLYGRESRHPGRTDDPPSWIRELAGFGGVATCLYTSLPANIEPLTPDRLAELAVRSAGGEAGRSRRDGITYLDAQLRRGAVTPLSHAYADAILARTGAADLGAAWKRARGHGGAT